MCKQYYSIHFCACASIDPIPYPRNLENAEGKQDDYSDTHLIWKLNRYLGNKNSSMMGEMIMPLQRLSEEITTDQLIIDLKQENMFDFSYIPKVGDNLIIRQAHIYKPIKGFPRPDLYDYISLIYRNGSWQDDFYNVFSDKTRMYKKGVIKFRSYTQKSI
ncbi:hypothetical protein SAMN04487764_2982 [Gillisia sp. Hel1_33_143]|uniref:hypothetical protein n=1 Tax=Gillisia sp. Hel1_33_143 TaxID=1336796 RepID=UPI00087C7B6A|nr:hypothetical protein [Gillisia sp. Hel1_33_143]SDS75703.1 hypothetical protein SAMN04487764_2982 [Gillisia sp. Hel1_33_143]